jgi:hypothetical protein
MCILKEKTLCFDKACYCLICVRYNNLDKAPMND